MTGLSLSGQQPLSSDMILEVCANSIQSAKAAGQGGADRIELCRDLALDGLTPELEVLEALQPRSSGLSIPVFVLIRPRAGDFVYSESEIEQMIDEIELVKRLNYPGVVIGVLSQNKTINLLAMHRLVVAAEGLQVTFHKAFDEVIDPFEALDQLKELGVHRVLTAGQATHVGAGVKLLTQLVARAGNDIVIMPGGGLRPENVALALQTGAREYHSSCIPAGQEFTDPEIVSQLKSSLSRG